MSILKRPLLTEKYTQLGEKLKQYGFIVNRKATKEQIRKEIEKIYEVKVDEIRTMVYAGKKRNRYSGGKLIQGRTDGFKKAIVKLKEGDTIDFYANI
jgi:large subunit ribosomal protein L23